MQQLQAFESEFIGSTFIFLPWCYFEMKLDMFQSLISFYFLEYPEKLWYICWLFLHFILPHIIRPTLALKLLESQPWNIRWGLPKEGALLLSSILDMLLVQRPHGTINDSCKIINGKTHELCFSSPTITYKYIGILLTQNSILKAMNNPLTSFCINPASPSPILKYKRVR